MVLWECYADPLSSGLFPVWECGRYQVEGGAVKQQRKVKSNPRTAVVGCVRLLGSTCVCRPDNVGCFWCGLQFRQIKINHLRAELAATICAECRV